MTVRADLLILYTAEDKFDFGGHKAVREGRRGNRHIVIVASGYLVHSCMKAAQLLAKINIDATVVDAYALPMNVEPVLLAGASGKILLVEDTYVGGVGGELACPRKTDVRSLEGNARRGLCSSSSVALSNLSLALASFRANEPSVHGAVTTEVSNPIY